MRGSWFSCFHPKRSATTPASNGPSTTFFKLTNYVLEVNVITEDYLFVNHATGVLSSNPINPMIDFAIFASWPWLDSTKMVV